MSSKSHSGRRPRLLANYPGTRQFLKLFIFSALTLVVLYFVVTSSAFLKSMVLPRVAKSLNAAIEVETLSVSPFSKVQITKLRLTPTGEDKPLVEADEVLLRYNLFSIIRGKMAVSEVRLVRPVVNVVHRADGNANYGPLLSGQSSATSRPSSQAPEVRIGQLVVQEGVVRFTQAGSDGGTQTSSISKLQVNLENVANEESGKLEFTADVAQLNQGPAGNPTLNGGLAAQANGNFKFAFDKSLMPANVQGDVKLAVSSAAGILADLAEVRANLACDVTTNEVRQLALRVQRRDQALGQMNVTGPIDLTRSEARLRLELKAIDRNVLNLAGAAFGLDFGETSISGSHLIDVSRRGELITAKGTLKADKLSVKQGELVTPALDIAVAYQVSVSFEDQTVKSQEFQLTATQAGTPFLSAGLKRALSITWGKSGTGADSSLGVTVTNLNLANWRLLLPTNLISGIVNLGTEITFGDEGKRLSGDITGTVSDLSVAYGEYGIKQAVADLRTRLVLSEYRSVLLENFNLALQEQGRPLVTATGGAGFDSVTYDTTLQLNATADLPVLLTKVIVPDLSATSGRVTLAVLANQDKGQTKATVNLALSQFDGQYGDFRFKNYDTRIEADGETLGEELSLRRLTLAARQGTADGGSVDFSGKYHLVRHDGEFKLVLANLNQSALAPLLDPLLAPLTLASVAVDGDGTLKYTETGRSSVSMRANILKLRVADPQKRAPGDPLDFHFDMDAGMTGQKFDLTRAVFELPPTPRATNQIEVVGMFDLSTNKPSPSTLRLTADSLDFTPLYDLFMTNSAFATAPASGAPEPEGEPAAVQLPVRQFTADAKVGRMFLRALAVTNFQAGLAISNDVVRINPVTLTLNGAPVEANARVDLARAGYDYDFGFRATNVPLGPLTRTLEYDQAGEVKGNATALAQIRGAGITGPNLQKNLAGQFGLSSTNLSLALGNVRSKLLTTTINTVISIPDLIKNPSATLNNLVGQLTGSRRSEGGWVEDVAKAPIDTLSVRGKVGGGKVELEHALVRSPAFRVEARGEINLQPVMTNSTVNIPVSLALRRELAEKIGLRDAAAGTNYVAVPDFLTLRGTLGEPKSELKTAALIGITAKAGAGLLGNTGNASLDSAAGILGNLGNALTPQSGKPVTNAPAGAKTNPPAAFNPLDLLRPAPKKN